MPLRENISPPDVEMTNRIDQIHTEYTMIRQVLAKPISGNTVVASGEIEQGARKANQLHERQRFIFRYENAIKSFLGILLRNPEQVDQTWDVFIDKFLSGKLSGYDPSKGSFRIYLKRVLRTTSWEVVKKLGKENGVQNFDQIDESNVSRDSDDADKAFDEGLIETVFQRALLALKDKDDVQHRILEYVSEYSQSNDKNPSSKQLAAVASQASGKPITPENARKMKSRASNAFAHCVIDDVSELTGAVQIDEIEAALIDVGILPFCKKALAELRAKSIN